LEISKDLYDLVPTGARKGHKYQQEALLPKGKLEFSLLTSTLVALSYTNIFMLY
jgi:hypothetical protein